jgi:hypothetical protein
MKEKKRGKGDENPVSLYSFNGMLQHPGLKNSKHRFKWHF